jgi:hypothetical protein
MVLQNSMYVPPRDPDSSSEGTDAEEEGEEASTIPVIKTEPNASVVPAVSVTQISCRLYPELPAVCQSVL